MMTAAAEAPTHTLAPDAPLPFDVDAERQRLRRSIRQMRDPKTRAELAGEIAHRASEYHEITRKQRDQAVYALRERHKWSPVKVYRGADIPRSRYANILNREAESIARDGWLDIRMVQSTDYAAEVATVARKGVPEALKALADEARDVRDPAIRELLAGDEGQRMSNAALGRLTRLTGQRIAQLRSESQVPAAS